MPYLCSAAEIVPLYENLYRGVVMKFILLLIGSILISVPAFAQAQTSPQQILVVNSERTASVFAISAGAIAGTFLARNFLNRGAAMGFVGGHAAQIGRYGGIRTLSLGTGLVGTAIIVGSGILGGYIANGLFR